MQEIETWPFTFGPGLQTPNKGQFINVGPSGKQGPGSTFGYVTHTETSLLEMRWELNK